MQLTRVLPCALLLLFAQIASAQSESIAESSNSKRTCGRPAAN
jgi:hypothetical protein